MADHTRVWAQHQTITAFEHAVTAKHLRHGRADLLRPVADATTGEKVEIRIARCLRRRTGLVDVVDGEVG